MKAIPRVGRVRGQVTVPPSKSYTIRALLLAAMSEQETTILNPLDSDDSRFMLEAIRKIGFDVRGSFPAGLTIGPRISISANEVEIFVGNAGTAMRFLTGFLAFTPGRFSLTGDRRMNERPIADLVEPLRAIGGEIEYLGQPGFPPLQIRGKRMRGGFEVTVDGRLSSQFVSSLMMAGATLPGGIRLRISALSSQPYLEITMDILARFGATVEQPASNLMHISAPRLNLPRYSVEGDYSSGSYWIAAAAMTAGEMKLSGLRPDSAQGDRRFLDVLRSAGCKYEWNDTELFFRGTDGLTGGSFDLNAMPDVVPTLSAIAPFFSSPVEITNVANLRIKESDRIAALSQELARLGGKVMEREDGLLIHPGYGRDPAVVDPHQDHRLAMSFAIAGLRRGNITIGDEKVVSKSYPQFWRTLDQVVADSEEG